MRIFKRYKINRKHYETSYIIFKGPTELFQPLGPLWILWSRPWNPPEGTLSLSFGKKHHDDFRLLVSLLLQVAFVWFGAKKYSSRTLRFFCFQNKALPNRYHSVVILTTFHTKPWSNVREVHWTFEKRITHQYNLKTGFFFLFA